jgi:hypothetical protein
MIIRIEKRQLPWRRIDPITDPNLNSECIRQNKIQFEKKKPNQKKK